MNDLLVVAAMGVVARKRIGRRLMCAAIVYVSLTFSAGLAWAQKTTTNPDGSTRTTVPDDTYGKGGTRETTTSTNKDGATVTREMQRDADGRPMQATEQDGNNQTDITWSYDKHGRVTKVRVQRNGRKYIARKTYRDAKDDSGAASYEFYDDVADEWKPFNELVHPIIEDILKKFGLVLWPPVVHLSAGPGPRDTPKPNDNPKQQIPEKSFVQSDSSAATTSATAQLVGLVYDKDSRPRDQVTVSVTTDPKKYAGIPALGVIEMEVPATAGESAESSLQGMVVDLGDGRKQPANKPLTIQIAESATGIPVVLVGRDGKPIARSSVPVAQGSPSPITNTGQASDFTTPPVVQNLSIINGPLTGDGNITAIGVDNQLATIITETPREVVFGLPGSTTAKVHTLKVQDGPRSATAQITQLGLVLSANARQLQRGQSTNYSATVLLGPLPESVWQQGGASPPLMNPSEATKLAPGFQVPQAGQPGVVLFHLENASRQTITIKPSQNETITRVLHQQNFQGGQFIEAGVIQSKQSGGFDIKATVQTFFAPIHFVEPGNVAFNEGAIKEDTGEVPIPGIAAAPAPKPCTGTCNHYVDGQSTDPVKDPVVYCTSCNFCKSPCACTLWSRGKAPPGEWYPDWKFEGKEGEQIKKKEKTDYACFCTN